MVVSKWVIAVRKQAVTENFLCSVTSQYISLCFTLKEFVPKHDFVTVSIVHFENIDSLNETETPKC